MLKKVFKIILYIVIVFLIIAIALGLYALREIGKSPTKEELKSFEKLSYFKDGKFRSPQEMIVDKDNVRNGPAGFQRLFTRSKFAPTEKLPQVKLTKESFSETPSDYDFYWLGHSSAILEIDGKRIIFDPVLGNAAPIPFIVPRYNEAPLTREDFPHIDYVIITHNHYDHLERKSIQALKDSRFIVPLGVGTALVGWGVAKQNITELGWGDSFIKGNLQITAEISQHYSGRDGLATNKTLWNSYIIKSKNKNIYWSGDTGYGEHFKQIGNKYGPFDFVAIEIDAWNTGWPNIHIFPAEVIKATKELKSKKIIPIHWGVFDLALHPWNESIDMILNEAKNTNIEVLTPIMGEKINLYKSKTKKWW
ncbi:MBL fold metallo-hydrolase [bacterium]|nr:MBL fold metallo-hydrolase [bacterium]